MLLYSHFFKVSFIIVIPDNLRSRVIDPIVVNHIMSKVRGAYVFLALVCCCLSCTNYSRRDLVISKLKSTGDLTQFEIALEKLSTWSAESRLNSAMKSFPSKYSRANFVFEDFVFYKGIAWIRLGIDPTLISDPDVIINDKTISLNLPPVQVIDLSFPLDQFLPDSNSSQRALNKFNVADFDSIYYQSEEQIRRYIQGLNLKNAAEERIRKNLSMVLRAMGFININIAFRIGKITDEIG
jgi:hypothetical protein